MINLYISKLPGGYRLQHFDTRTGESDAMTYYFFSLEQAISLHIKTFSLDSFFINKIKH